MRTSDQDWAVVSWLGPTLILCLLLLMLCAPLDAAQGDPLPPEKRLYTFEMDDVTYAEILNEFARQSGLEIVGVPPSGKTSFNCCGEKMSFELVLNRLRVVLLNHPERLWLLNRNGQLDAVRIEYIGRILSIDRIFANLDAFRASHVESDELALVLYSPEGDASEEPALEQFLPMYVRGSRSGETKSVTLFGVAQDLRRYLALAQMLAAGPENPRELVERFQPARLDCEQAVKCIRAVFGRVRVYETIETEALRDESDPTAPTTSQPGPADVLVWVHPACRTLVVRAPVDELAQIADVLERSDVPRADRVEAPSPGQHTESRPAQTGAMGCEYPIRIGQSFRGWALR